ncbi:Nucleoside recognition [Propionispira arboris]|jgi:nucleoside recognition membrane protein YjiH|uniref:Nucleoside recognition n=1 Tax=Propionispira arboris TaxID=84035 RepID=A0A1H7BKP5_9FIRM|nr:nucleoside recognition domain-containing protein [Propionispira arboris]SEJ75132.1 Nucleoside recognition [Propionispira arboris]
MDEQKTEQAEPNKISKVPIIGYIVLFLGIIFFSGIFTDAKGIEAAFDFNAINGAFGKIKEGGSFLGIDGTGAKNGFMFAITLVPPTMLSLGVVAVIEHLGGLRAAQRILTPLLQPLMGLPGVVGLALVSSTQSTDAGAGMTKMLREQNLITEEQRTVFVAFQFSAGAAIGNFLSTGIALFAFSTVPIIFPLCLIMVLKVVGANLMRLYIRKVVKLEEL